MRNLRTNGNEFNKFFQYFKNKYVSIWFFINLKLAIENIVYGSSSSHVNAVNFLSHAKITPQRLKPRN